MKLCVDAKRQPPPEWAWAKMSCSAIAFLSGGNVEHITFAPDQRKLVKEVIEWMIANNVHPRIHEVHKRTFGVNTPLIVRRAVTLAS